MTWGWTPIPRRCCEGGTPVCPLAAPDRPQGAGFVTAPQVRNGRWCAVDTVEMTTGRGVRRVGDERITGRITPFGCDERQASGGRLVGLFTVWIRATSPPSNSNSFSITGTFQGDGHAEFAVHLDHLQADAGG